MKDQLRALVDFALPEILGELKLGNLDKDRVPYDVELPKVKAHGDLSTNIAFQLGRTAKKNPYEVAVLCQKVLENAVRGQKRWQGWVQGISVEKPGFINFRLTESSLASKLLDIAKQDQNFGRSDVGRGTKVLIEFVSANPTGPLTIAHGRQAAIGDTLARIFKMLGHEVHKEFYLNDSGRQIGLLGRSLWARYQELFGRKAQIPEEGYQGTYLVDIARELKEKKADSLLKVEETQAIQEATDFAVQSILGGIQEDLARARVIFDEYFSERSLYERALIERALEELKKKDLCYEAEGALWFRSTRFGDDKDRVLRKSTGDYTYLAPDIAYHQWKFERGFKKLVNLWGPDHHGYAPRLQAACEALGHSKDQLKILIVQLTTLYRKGEPVRMSTRAGEFITLRELMDEVGVDAARFFFLMRKVESHLDFDLELAKQKSDENPVYYLQYAHARISSILAYAKQGVEREVDFSLIREGEALDLIKKMLQYPDVLKQAAEHLEPYRVADYLRELAVLFHRFYTFHRVVSDQLPLTKARLLLTDCVRIVLRNGLEILGVSAPKKM
ncbi:MAG: arginine--tRNA ligase [Candidatus Omnitrophica bacterium]|nr:arginine--tRNA ligase [Candidatus Omnitrophota bacterium]